MALWPTPAPPRRHPLRCPPTLDGWWLSGGDLGDRPLAILNNGSDGTVVDMLAWAIAAIERG